MKKWTKIASIPVNVDLTNWEPGLASNGGKYSFTEYLDVFLTIVDGTGYLRTVTRFGTSAEFSYDELLGGFQSDLEQISFINSDEKYMSRYSAPLSIEEMSTPILYADLLKLENKILNTDGEVEMWPSVPAHKEQEIFDKVLAMPDFKRWEMQYPELKESWDTMYKHFQELDMNVPNYAIDIYESKWLSIYVKETAFQLLAKVPQFDSDKLESAFDWATNCPKDNVDFWFKIYQSLYN
jgi:hypothetical protein